MKQYLALGFLLLAAQACSNGDVQQAQQPLKTEQKVVANIADTSGEKKANRGVEGASVAKMSDANREKLETALCEKVAQMPDDYSQEEQILCASRAQQ